MTLSLLSTIRINLYACIHAESFVCIFKHVPIKIKYLNEFETQAFFPHTSLTPPFTFIRQ